MKTVTLPLGPRSYDIVVGRGLLAEAARLDGDKGRARKAFVVADARLGAHAKKLVRELERAGWTTVSRAVRASEALKDIHAIYPLYGWLLKNGADRDSVIFALGGGTIGDAIGFVAATYLRGIRWVGIPTTLLAQVDSAIGGKTGINHAVGKNLIGAFHQPAKVVCETSFLGTLPERELVSGLGEMIKYGLIYDPKLYGWLEDDWRQVVSRRGDAIERAVHRCAELKARAVSPDEHDRRGVREVLNFGHTVGHAIESATSYGYYRHGEAIILGMRAAALISVVRGHLAPATQDRIEEFLARLPLPALPASVRARALVGKLKFDKKAESGRVRFVLLKRIGQTVSDKGVTDLEALAAIEAVIASVGASARAGARR